MSIEQFAEYLVYNIAKESDLVKVKKFETEEGNILEILVSESDMPRVIGRQGVVANSIKTLIQAKAYNDGVKNLKINIDSF
jgi:RNA-binding protein (KH domain)